MRFERWGINKPRHLSTFHMDDRYRLNLKFLIVDVLKIKYLFFLENLSSVQKTQELNLGTVLLLIITARLYKRQYTKLF